MNVFLWIVGGVGGLISSSGLLPSRGAFVVGVVDVSGMCGDKTFVFLVV